MPRKIVKVWQQYKFFWLSILFHLILFLSLSLSVLFQFKPEKRPSLYIPSYVYQGEMNTPVQHNTPKNIVTSKNGIEKPSTSHSSGVPSANQFQPVKSANDADPVHLIGEKNVDAPLLKLLGQAISKHLVYPKIALDFNTKGVVLVRFTVHPDGTVTDIQMVKSSSAGVLDEAAIAAINAMTPGNNVGKYVDKPKSMVFGIIFG